MVRPVDARRRRRSIASWRRPTSGLPTSCTGDLRPSDATCSLQVTPDRRVSPFWPAFDIAERRLLLSRTHRSYIRHVLRTAAEQEEGGCVSAHGPVPHREARP